ncbi:methyltransferase [Aquincola sp. J276]|uniref:class I SAM-dependent methyltransferase n=1 Tax=Aquincola sp. J276 TaxID=2898432 RepID=UPI002151DCD8|nr:SAM-dependent methyltransferase [Aquincola sp. J276]MCR5868812.1 SAM-dependent methyltransferase [Aquincola sp. J276]
MPGYETKQERIAVAGVDDLFIRSLLDRQQFSDPHGDAADIGISSATWPLFGLLWPSGAELAALLAMRPVRGAERILEMGCGLGLASLVGHRRGADITASDCHPLTGAFLQANLLLNGLAPMKYRYGHWRTPLPPLPREGEAAQLAVDGPYDLLIGSDLLYDRDAADDLAGFIELHAGAAAEVWIVDPDRGNRAAFNRHMAGQGFTLTEQRLDRAETAAVAGYKGRLLSYVRHLPPQARTTLA